MAKVKKKLSKRAKLFIKLRNQIDCVSQEIKILADICKENGEEINNLSKEDEAWLTKKLEKYMDEEEILLTAKITLIKESFKNMGNPQIDDDLPF